MDEPSTFAKNVVERLGGDAIAAMRGGVGLTGASKIDLNRIPSIAL